MSAGICPSCGRPNPPGRDVCVHCKAALGNQALPAPIAPPEVTASPVRGARTLPPGTVYPEEVVRPEPPREVDPTPEEEKAAARSWWLVPAVVVLAIVLVIAGVYIVERYLPGLHSPVQPTPVTIGEFRDLCELSSGANCQGSSIALPETSATGGVTNTTGCDTVPVLGPSELLWLNITNAGPNRVLAIVLAPGQYAGGTVSWTLTPWLVQNNSSEIRAAPWFQGVAPGSSSLAVPIPQTNPSWCFGWWVPSGSVQLTLNSDLSVTYDGTRSG